MIGRRELVLWGTAGLLERRPSPSRSKANRARGPGRPIRPCVTISSAMPANGRSTTSRAPLTAGHGPSAACSPLHSNTRASGGGRPRETGRPSRMRYCE